MKKIEYCQYCKSDINDKANWCRECLSKKSGLIGKKKKKTTDDDKQGELL
jgi:hypothetical protein